MSQKRGLLLITFGRETDGRWIAEVKGLPGVLAYGKTRIDARRKASAIALRTLADKAERGKTHSAFNRIFEYGMARG